MESSVGTLNDEDIIQEVLNHNNELESEDNSDVEDIKFSLKEGLLLKAYFFLKQLSQSDVKAFGLDKSDVVVEQVPLIYQPISNIPLSRKFKEEPA